MFKHLRLRARDHIHTHTQASARAHTHARTHHATTTTAATITTITTQARNSQRQVQNSQCSYYCSNPILKHLRSLVRERTHTHIHTTTTTTTTTTTIITQTGNSQREVQNSLCGDFCTNVFKHLHIVSPQI